MKALSVRSSAFENDKLIPSEYTCDGDDTSPPLTVEAIPEGTASLVLILDDPDAPMGTWVHWVVWNIPPINKIDAHTVPGIEGINSFRKHSYGGPCPPSGTHRYFFKVYALETKLDLNPNSLKQDLEKAMQGNILAEGQLIGLYRRTR